MSCLPTVLQGNKALHEALASIEWLLGKWISSSGKGSYPTIKPFVYSEQIEFSSLGQPMLNYSSYSWNPELQKPMHLESGFLRIKPGTKELSLMVSHNFGVTTIEEGLVAEKTITLTSSSISRMQFAKDPKVTKLVRTFTLKEGDVLEQVIQMETDRTPLTEHLRINYQKT